MHHPRQFVSQAAGLVGVVLYNWWIFVADDAHALRTTNELFSDLEASGQPHALLFGRLDLAAGSLMALALLLGRRRRVDRRPGDLLTIFGVAAAVGGLFPYSCAEGIDRACREAEWSMTLPWQHYVHVVAGIVEFASATIAIILLRSTTAGARARVVQRVTQVLMVGYPLLAAAYLTDRFGAYIEPVFFLSFSAAVVLVLSMRGSESTGTAGVRFTDRRTTATNTRPDDRHDADRHQ